MEKETILVTGAGGFLGRYVVPLLLRRGYRVLGTSRQPVDWGDVYVGDYHALTLAVDCPADYRKLDQYLAIKGIRVNGVVHLAAALMVNNCPPWTYFSTNSLGTYYLLEWCRLHDVRKVVYTQTHSDLNRFQGIFVGDNQAPEFGPTSSGPGSVAFITSKLAAGELVNVYTRENYIDGITLRLANMRGVGSQDRKVKSVFWQFIEKARRGDPIELWGARETMRDLVYVKDVARAVLMAYQAHGRTGVFNIGSGQGLTIEQEAEGIITAFCSPGRRSALVYRPDVPEVRTHSLVFVIDKARFELGWRPRFTYIEAMKDMRTILDEEVKNASIYKA